MADESELGDWLTVEDSIKMRVWLWKSPLSEACFFRPKWACIGQFGDAEGEEQAMRGGGLIHACGTDQPALAAEMDLPPSSLNRTFGAATTPTKYSGTPLEPEGPVMAPSIIRMNGKGKWGTAFAVDDGSGAPRFYTAAHVLTDIGVQEGASHASVLMCDDSPAFFGGPQPFDINSIAWDVDCDLVSFTSTFPACPFALGTALPAVDTIMNVTGYLWRPDGSMPDCGESVTLSGPLTIIGQGNGCLRKRLTIALATAVADLDGMSGGPVTVANNGSEVIAVFNGAPQEAGGPPFLATSIL